MIAYNTGSSLVELGGKTTSLYAVCSTPSSTAAKTVTIPNFESINTGATFRVKFTYTNTAANPTLQINDTAAKPIIKHGSTAPGVTVSTSWENDSIITLTYDGTSYVMNSAADNGVSYVEITYDEWLRLTPEQQAAEDYFISDYPGVANIEASEIPYNNVTSGLSANNVQSAIDEVNASIYDTTYELAAGTGDDANKIILTPSEGDAQKVTVPYATSAGDAGTVNGKTVAENVPSGAVFTDTTAAESLTYDNSTSSLSSTAVQGAIDEVVTTLSNKANSSDLGTAAAKNASTVVTSGSEDLVTSGAVFTAIENLPEPMVFRGSLGTGGTITALPVDGSASIGDTYKVITDGTYDSKAAKVGDTFICLTKTSSANTWELIPSGDEPSGTVTSITLQATSPISIDSSSAITTSGTRTLSHANSGATAGSYGDSAAQTPNYGDTFKVPYVTVNATGHVTAISEHTVKIPASDNTNTTYTFANGTNGFTVTPSGGSAQTVTITPSITNNITGSGTSGYIAKFNGANTITNGPAFGTTTTTYLNNAGNWATPPDTKNTAGSTDTSSKIFLVGATSQAANPQTYSDNEVYVTSGVLTTKSVQLGGTAATMQYNSTNKCIDFIFA